MHTAIAVGQGFQTRFILSHSIENLRIVGHLPSRRQHTKRGNQIIFRTLKKEAGRGGNISSLWTKEMRSLISNAWYEQPEKVNKKGFQFH